MSKRYAFLAEWDDPISQQVRSYTVCFFPEDNSVEMIDNKQKRVFLRRTAVPNKLSEFFIGGAVSVYGRQLKVVGYADSFTEMELGSQLERTLLLVKPEAVGKLASILSAIDETGLQVVCARMADLSSSDAVRFACSAGTAVGVEVVGASAISSVAALAGRLSCYASAAETAVSDLDLFFGAQKMGATTCAASEKSALCVVKPSLFARSAATFAHVLRELQAGGFEITGIVTHTLNKAQAEEFLEVYKGVVQEYPQMVHELSSGPALALEVTGGTSDDRFRDFCGPSDPEIAKQLRPHTLRAKFGEDKVKNGFHCTDLPEDISLELEYFFKILE